MSKITSASNFLHKLTSAQKEVFKNSKFSISTVVPCVVITPLEEGRAENSRLPKLKNLTGSQSLEAANQVQNNHRQKVKSPPEPPPPYRSTNSGSNISMVHQESLSQGSYDEVACDNQQPVMQKRRRGSNRSGNERRRHSSILQHSEWEKERKREGGRSTIEHVTVADTSYALVSKDKKKTSVPERGERAPPPAKSKLGYVQLHFHTDPVAQGSSSHQTPTSNESRIPKDIRTKWDYSTIIFDKNAEKEKELFESGKINKRLPPPPPEENNGLGNQQSQPQPLPRRKKPDSLPEAPSQRRPVDIDAYGFTSPTRSLPVIQNGMRKKISPPLPPKEDEFMSAPTPTQGRPVARPR